ncbi:MAG: hypothetical protein ACP5OE_09685, partial [Thermodesulfobium sp.]
PLTEEFAVDAVNRRIKLYSESRPDIIAIEEKGLRNAFHILRDRLKRGLTFRDFLDHIRERLELNQFQEVGLSVKIHIETADAVRASLIRTSLGESYNSVLRDISYSIPLRRAFQNTVLNIFNNKGISENDDLFKKNEGTFYLLRKYDLIVQRKRPEESYFRWYFSDEFLKVVLTTAQNMSLTPVRTLKAAFEEQAMMKITEPSSIYGASQDRFNTLISTWQDSIPEITSSLRSSQESINNISKDLSESNPIRPSDLQNSIINIIKPINSIVTSKKEQNEPFKAFSDSWIAPENIDEIKGFLSQADRVNLSSTNPFGILHNHNKLTSQLLDLLSDLVKGESISRLEGRSLLSKEFDTIHYLRKKFLSQGYIEVVDGICSRLERSIRDAIYPCLRTIWGSEIINVIPSDIINKINVLPDRGHPRTKRPNDVNFFYDVSRSEYSKILFSNKIEKALLSDIMNENDRKKFRETLELAFALDDRNSHRDRESYFRNHATEILDILKDFPRTLEIFHILTLKFLIKCDINLQKKNDSLLAQFLPQMANVIHQKIHIIPKEVVNECMKEILNSAATNVLVIENLTTFFGSYKPNPEITISIFRAALKLGYLKVSDEETPPIKVSLTDSGRNLLTKYV